MNYIRRHWRGELSLAKSFWLNFFLLNYAGAIILEKCYDLFTIDLFIIDFFEVTVLFFLGYLVVYISIVYPWQIIGLWRACNSHIKSHKKYLWARICQIVVILSVGINTIGIWSALPEDLSINQIFKTLGFGDYELGNYTLELDRNNTLLRLKGSLDPGVSKSVNRMLKNYPEINGIVLDTSGGRAFEGKRLSNLVEKYNLDTYAFNKCCSAGTTVFVAGNRRYLINDAYFGFHRPGVDEDEISGEIIERFIEIDISLYKRKGVQKDFYEKIESVPYDDMWFPTTPELLDAGFIHGIVDSNLLPIENTPKSKSDKDRELLNSVLKRWRENQSDEALD